jgi:hypothetical protein
MLNKKVFFLPLFLLVIPLVTFAAVSGCTGDGCTLPNPLTGVGSPQILIGKVIVAALGVVGSLALLMFIYGGFIWMTAAGNQEMVTRGRNVLIWATIGLIIIFSSYAIVKFVFQGVGAPIT